MFAAAFLLAAFFCLCGTASAAGAVAGPLAPNPNEHERPVVDAGYYKILVDIQSQILTVLRKDDDGNYTVIDRQMVCSTARDGEPMYTGTFKIDKKVRWLHSESNDLHPDLYEQYACRIYAGEGIWFHSTCYFKMKNDALERESYTDLGSPASAGCVRLCVRDAAWIYANCPEGTSVQVVESGGPPAVCLEALPPLPDGVTCDPTDPAISH